MVYLNDWWISRRRQKRRQTERQTTTIKTTLKKTKMSRINECQLKVITSRSVVQDFVFVFLFSLYCIKRCTILQITTKISYNINRYNDKHYDDDDDNDNDDDDDKAVSQHLH